MMMLSGKFRVLLGSVVGVGLLLSTTSLAHGQTINIGDGEKIEAELSLQFPTRLFFEYDAGSELIFNQPEGSTPEVAATVDSKGDVYLSVLSGQPGEKIAGFLTTKTGRTYVMDLTVKMKEAAQIKVINKELAEKARRAKIQDTVETDQLETVKWNRTSGHHKSISSLMTALYHDQVPEGFKRQTVLNFPSKVQDGVKRRVVRHYASQSVEGHVYELTNGNEFVLQPETLSQAYAPYVAFAVSGSIDPGKTGRVFVIRKKGGS